MPSEIIPLLAALTRLWNDLYNRVRQFPKLDKHLLGARLLDDGDTCLLAILRALSDHDGRSRHLIEASALYDRLKIHMRIAVKREILPERWYADRIHDIAEIGRMLGGWSKTTQETSAKIPSSSFRPKRTQ